MPSARPFGLHVSAAGGLPRAVERAEALGCDCFQIFVGNPRGWAEREVGEAEAEEFREARRVSGLGPVVVHLTYLPNLASPQSAAWRKACAVLRREVDAARRLGAELFVLHPGSALDRPRAEAIGRVAAALDAELERAVAGPRLLLENTAGGGGLLGAEPEELAEIAGRTGAPERLGVCLDTAHACAVGHDLSPAGVAALAARFASAFGRAPVALLHLNDLRAEPGAGRDRHEHLGHGSLGRAGLAAVLACPALAGIPAVLETPVEDEGDERRNLSAARRLQRIAPRLPGR